MPAYNRYSTPAGHIVIFFYDFRDNSLQRWVRPYYVSKKDRLCFRYGPGLFDGMNRKRLGQFELSECFAFMYTLDLKDQDYYVDKAHFMRCVLKTIARRQSQS